MPRTFGLLLACFLLIYVFFDLIPMPWRSEHSILLSVVGGFIFLFVYALFVYSFELPVHTAYRGTLNTIKGLTVVASIFVFGYFMIRTTFDFETNELNDNGIPGIGVVVNRYWVPGKGNVSYTIVLGYRDNKGENHKTDIPVSKRHYELLPQGTKVDIIYSSRFPQFARITSYPKSKYGEYLFHENDPLRQLEEKAREMRKQRDSLRQKQRDSATQANPTGL